MITALQTLSSRNLSPLSSAVLSLGTIHGGTAGNIIITDKLLNGFKVAYTGVAKEVTLEVEIQGGMIPAPEYEDGVAPTGEEGE